MPVSLQKPWEVGVEELLPPDTTAADFMQKLDRVLRGRWRAAGYLSFYPPFYLAVQTVNAVLWARVVWVSRGAGLMGAAARYTMELSHLLLELNQINQKHRGTLLFGEALREYIEADPHYPRTPLQAVPQSKALAWAGFKS